MRRHSKLTEEYTMNQESGTLRTVFLQVPSILHACVCVLNSFSHVWLCMTRWTIAHQAPLSMGFSRQEYWSRFPCLPPGDLLDPGIKHAAPALQKDSLPWSHWGSPSFDVSFNKLVNAGEKKEDSERETKQIKQIQVLWLTSTPVLTLRVSWIECCALMVDLRMACCASIF